MKEKFVSLVKSRGATGELFEIKTKHRSVNFENNHFKGIDEGEISGFAVRVKKDGKMGFSYAMGDARLEDVVNSAFEVLRFSKDYMFEFSSEKEIPEVKCYDPEIEKESREDAMDLGEELVEYVRSLKEEMKVNFSQSSDIIEESIITTNGFDHSFKKTVKTISLGGFYTEENNFLEIYAEQSRSLNNLFDIETLKEKFKTDILASKNNVSVKSGAYPVIFTPFAVSDLMLPLLVAINGKNVISGVSLLKGKLTKEVLSPNFTLIDNPLLSGGAFSFPFDDEGTSAARKELISKGQLLNYLADRDVSSRLGIRGGNAQRSITSVPVPSSSNLLIQPGDVSVSDMLSVECAILVESLMGVSMGNISGGFVTGNVELGYLVERGKILGRVKNAMINLNIFDKLKDIALSKENIWVSKFISPYIYVPDVSVSSK